MLNKPADGSKVSSNQDVKQTRYNSTGYRKKASTPGVEETSNQAVVGATQTLSSSLHPAEHNFAPHFEGDKTLQSASSSLQGGNKRKRKLAGTDKDDDKQARIRQRNREQVHTYFALL